MNVLEMIFFGISATVTSKSETCQTVLTRKDSSLGMTHYRSAQKYWLKGASFTGCRNGSLPRGGSIVYTVVDGELLSERRWRKWNRKTEAWRIWRRKSTTGWPRRKISSMPINLPGF